MEAIDRTPAPIYDRLIAERGDVVADAAHVAANALRKAADVLDFSKAGADTDTNGGQDTNRPSHADAEAAPDGTGRSRPVPEPPVPARAEADQ
ncbi:hypothetical protein ACWGIV_34750 [Streptomyces sp. NPDC054844]